MTFNVLPDHVHALIVAKSENELGAKVGNVKGYVSHRFRKENALITRLWARKFHRQWIQSDQHLVNVIRYIDTNHLKHEGSWGKSFLCGFRPEFEEIVGSVCQSPREMIEGHLGDKN